MPRLENDLVMHDYFKILFLGNENQHGFLTRILYCNYTKIIPIQNNFGLFLGF